MNAPDHDIRAVYRTNVAWLLLLTLLVSIAWLWFALSPVPLGKSVMLQRDPVVQGRSDLCPGEALHIHHTVTVSAPGVVDFDVTVWALSPRRMILQRPTPRMVLAETKEWTVEWRLPMPESYVNPRTGEFERWLPGEYRLAAAFTSVSQDTVTSMMSITFTIREGCE
jgi:hypothetical protein